MLDLYIKLLGIEIKLNVEFKSTKKPINEDKTPIDENIAQKEYNSFDEKEHEEYVDGEEHEEIKLSEIQSQALRFEEDLKSMGIYDIPSTSDIAPTYEIQDDVEIITDNFEKEQEDMIKDRRR